MREQETSRVSMGEERQWSRRSTPELNALLEGELLGKEPLEDQEIEGILEELSRRAKAAGTLPDVRTARASFREYAGQETPLYPEEEEQTPPAGPGGKRGESLGRTLLVAALLTALAAAPAAGQTGQVAASQVMDSPQIKSQWVQAQMDEDGQITVGYEITGRGEVLALGVQELSVSRQVNGLWLETARYDRSIPDLWQAGETSDSGQYRYEGQPGAVYQVAVTVFAENREGSDSVRQTFLLTPPE